jgi:hypothetical protein
MQQTPNLNLNKPEGTDVVNIDDLNANMDILDAKLGASGHSHNGTAGQGPKITAAGLDAGAADDTAIGNRTITDTVVAASGAGTITNLLSKIGYMIKSITGKANWYTLPAITLETVNNSLGVSGHSHNGTAGQGPKIAYANITGTPTSLPANGGTSAACSGNAATATKLATARTINGVAFDGSANITVTAAANGGNAATVGGAAPGTEANNVLKLDSGGKVPAANLPIATAAALGGVKVGSGLSIDGGGVLSAPQTGIYITERVLGVTGHTKWSDGYIEQWGTTHWTGTQFTFPIPFPTECDAVYITQYDGNVPTLSQVKSLSKTGFLLDSNNNGTCVYYRAVGY